jgi:hypothetical protein
MRRALTPERPARYGADMNRQEAKDRAKREGVPRETYDTAVVETYHQHDREGKNQESREAFAANPPALDAEQQRCLDALTSDGIAITSFGSLVGDDDLWARLVEDSAAFAATAPSNLAPTDHDGENEELVELQAQLAACLEKGKQEKAEKIQARIAKITSAGTRKDTFIARQFAHDPSSVIGTPWLEFAASPRVLDVINSYLKMYVKVRYIDEWYTAVSDSEAERITSQRWHRDNDDQYLVKTFLYMNDVDLGSGPFEYIPRSALGGPYADIWPWQPLGQMYPPQDEFPQQIPEDSRVTLTGPPGTLALVNTSGFHRGGFATESHRVMSIITYCSPAALESIVEKGFQVDVDSLPAGTPESVKQALA